MAALNRSLHRCTAGALALAALVVSGCDERDAQAAAAEARVKTAEIGADLRQAKREMTAKLAAISVKSLQRVEAQVEPLRGDAAVDTVAH